MSTGKAVGKDVYDYTTPQVVAMWKAYCAAPNDTTVAELRELMDAAAAAVPAQEGKL